MKPQLIGRSVTPREEGSAGQSQDDSRKRAGAALVTSAHEYFPTLSPHLSRRLRYDASFRTN